jgi:uncharacterized lipoprotein YmbA
MNQAKLINTPLVFAILLIALTGCGTTPTPKFYLLEPSAPAALTANSDSLPIIVLAPVRIPHYLDRAQIVTASGDNGYQLSELNRWAEGLDHNINRVLQQDLSQLVPANVLPSAPSDSSPLKLAVTILEFHVNAQGQANLKAQWQLSRGSQIVSLQQQNYLEPASSSDYQKMVAGLNACLRRLTGDVAKNVLGALQL